MNVLAPAWSAIARNKTPSARGWLTRRIYPNAPCGLFAAIAHPTGERAFLVEVAAADIPSKVDYPQANGFRTFPETVSPGPKGRVRLCTVLVDHEYEEVFDRLAEDVCAIVADTPDSPSGVRNLIARLHVWQRFLHAQGRRLSAEAERGLFGELHFLRSNLLLRLTAKDAVASWKGPERGLHDFVLRGTHVEVKTSTHGGDSTFQIANIAQLDERATDTLILYHLTLAPSSEGETLPELISQIADSLSAEDQVASSRFHELLLQAGYHDAQKAHYTERYSPKSPTYFAVRDSFPRLRVRDVPQGIVEVSYTVRKALCEPFTLTLQEAQRLLFAEDD